MRYAYREACSEVCFILDNLESGSRGKIPEKIVDLLEKNKIKHYPVNIDLSVPLNKQVLKAETKAILALLYRKFLCSESERTILEKNFQQKLKEEKMEMLADNKNPEIENKKIETEISQKEILDFAIINSDSNIKKIENEISLIEEKETVFSKVWSTIKKIFHIK